MVNKFWCQLTNDQHLWTNIAKRCQTDPVKNISKKFFEWNSKQIK